MNAELEPQIRMDRTSFGVQFPPRPAFFPSFTAVFSLMLKVCFKKKQKKKQPVLFLLSSIICSMNESVFHQNSFIYRPNHKLAVAWWYLCFVTIAAETGAFIEIKKAAQWPVPADSSDIFWSVRVSVPNPFHLVCASLSLLHLRNQRVRSSWSHFSLV